MELLKPKSDDENIKYIQGIIQAFEQREPAISRTHTRVKNTQITEWEDKISKLEAELSISANIKVEYEEINAKYLKIKKSGEESEAISEKAKSMEKHLDESNKIIES